MSYFSLYQQLSIEFMTDPTFDKSTAQAELSDLWAAWRKGHGRHVAIDRLSAEFNQWWQSHYAESLRPTGTRGTYRQFIASMRDRLR